MEPLLQHVTPFLMVVARLSGLFIFTPMLSSASVPVQARVLFMMVFAVAVYPTIPPSQMRPVPLDVAAMAPMIGTELLIGLAIGVLAAMPMFAVQLAGVIVGQQLGLGLASVYNPATDTESDVLGELLLYMAMATFIALGGLEAAFLALLRTFEGVPLGGFESDRVPLDMLLALLRSGFELALRVSAPVLCILMLETLASGLIMKTIPQINIMSIGFAIKIVAGMISLVSALVAIDWAVGEEMSAGLAGILRWAEGL